MRRDIFEVIQYVVLVWKGDGCLLDVRAFSETWGVTKNNFTGPRRRETFNVRATRDVDFSRCSFAAVARGLASRVAVPIECAMKAMLKIVFEGCVEPLCSEVFAA